MGQLFATQFIMHTTLSLSPIDMLIGTTSPVLQVFSQSSRREYENIELWKKISAALQDDLFGDENFLHLAVPTNVGWRGCEQLVDQIIKQCLFHIKHIQPLFINSGNNYVSSEQTV
jgi:hypothetical protein